MKNVFTKAIEFIKENPRIIYSLVLVIVIPAAFFINTYLINSNYEKNIDLITQRKAVLVENIINNIVSLQNIDDPKIQAMIEKVKNENDEIVSLLIAKPLNEKEKFPIIASSDPNLLGKDLENSTQNSLAWTKPEGVAFLDRNLDGRFWNVTKLLVDESGKKLGLVSISFSLNNTDALVNQTIYRSYWVLIIIIAIVVLLVSNQTRLLGYALTVTKLKEIDKMKDTFVSMASHELRSPLTAIRGYTEFLSDKSASFDKDSQHYITNISISVERLQDLVNDILEVSRVEGNRLPIEITSFDPTEIIAQSIEELRSQAIAKNLALNYKPAEEPVMIDADTNRLKQILINLISNSIKYTEKGSVEISTGVQGKMFAITVADTGIGISSEAQANLFQKFYRVQTEKTKTIIGTGLGLWITQEILKKMNGSISVESIEGVGSHFIVRLPVAKK
jgi:signal transduction histidine kinase